MRSSHTQGRLVVNVENVARVVVHQEIDALQNLLGRNAVVDDVALQLQEALRDERAAAAFLAAVQESVAPAMFPRRKPSIQSMRF